MCLWINLMDLFGGNTHPVSNTPHLTLLGTLSWEILENLRLESSNFTEKPQAARSSRGSILLQSLLLPIKSVAN